MMQFKKIAKNMANINKAINWVIWNFKGTLQQNVRDKIIACFNYMKRWEK